MSLTIRQSFDRPLPREPQVKIGFKGNYRNYTSTVSSTVDTDAPNAFIKEDVLTFKTIAEKYFPTSGQLQSHMPVLEKTHLLNTEADVSRISTLQFLHPVNIALQEICPTGTQLVCANETQSGPRKRFDVQWSLYSNEGEHIVTLAVLEMKSTHVIHPQDFAPAEANEENFESKQLEAMSSDELTLLEGNALWLSKQAAKYAENCPYVAVFDWNAMFIFNYAYYNSAHGGAVRGTYFDEKGKFKDMTFRRILFAFVARALKDGT